MDSISQAEAWPAGVDLGGELPSAGVGGYGKDRTAGCVPVVLDGWSQGADEADGAALVVLADASGASATSFLFPASCRGGKGGRLS